MYRLSKETALTAKMINAYIENYSGTVARFEKLHRYYMGNHDILQRTMTAGKPNNRIPNPYPRFITDSFVGFMVGVPVTYNAAEDAQEQLEAIQSIFNYNDEASHNSDIARDMSIYGVACELLYIDEDTNIRFARLNPTEVIPIYNDSITGDLLYVIRYFDTMDILSDTPSRTVEVYDKDTISTYHVVEDELLLISQVQHFFNDVPVSIYLNNAEMQGDFEFVLPLIDSMDIITSDGVNETQYMADAYLVVNGVGDVDTGDNSLVETMKNSRLILLPDGSANAQWVVKNLNDAYIQNSKNDINQKIHKFSNVPPLTDENFSGNASGVAMRQKLLGFENATAKKIRTFKKGLQRRIELITNVLNLAGASFDYRNIDMTFTRNLPSNTFTDSADDITKLSAVISKETLLKQIPFIDDVQAEMQRIEAENAMPEFDIAAGGDEV